MEPLGINTGLLLTQLMVVMLMIGLLVISLIDLAKKKVNGTPLPIWVLAICVVPLSGSLAYWSIKPVPETK